MNEDRIEGTAKKAVGAAQDIAGKVANDQQLEGKGRINQAVGTLRPHVLCTYLYELAGEFSTFYGADKVIVDDPGTRARRLLLCARTLTWLETGLHLLGLRTLQRM